MGENVLAHAASALTDSNAGQTQPVAISTVLIVQIVVGLQTKSAKFALALVLSCISYLELFGSLRGQNVTHSLTVEDIHVVDFNSCDFLDLWNLRAKLLTAVVARHKQSAVFNEFALMTKTSLCRRFFMFRRSCRRLSLSGFSGGLDSRWLGLLLPIRLVLKLNLVEFHRTYEYVRAQAV